MSKSKFVLISQLIQYSLFTSRSSLISHFPISHYSHLTLPPSYTFLISHFPHLTLPPSHTSPISHFPISLFPHLTIPLSSSHPSPSRTSPSFCLSHSLRLSHFLLPLLLKLLSSYLLQTSPYRTMICLLKDTFLVTQDGTTILHQPTLLPTSLLAILTCASPTSTKQVYFPADRHCPPSMNQVC